MGLGHPTGRRFRSPGKNLLSWRLRYINHEIDLSVYHPPTPFYFVIYFSKAEMIPHLLWLERDPLVRDKLPCNCCLCISPKYQIKLAAQSPAPNPSLLVAVKMPNLQSVTLKNSYSATPMVSRVTAEATQDQSMSELKMKVDNAEQAKRLGDRCSEVPEDQEQSVELTFLNHGLEHFWKKPKVSILLSNPNNFTRISLKLLIKTHVIFFFFFFSTIIRTTSKNAPNIYTYSMQDPASSLSSIPGPPSHLLPLQSRLHPIPPLQASSPPIPSPTLDSTPPQALGIRTLLRLLREHGTRGCLATWLSCGADPDLGRRICDCDTCVWWRIEQLRDCAEAEILEAGIGEVGPGAVATWRNSSLQRSIASRMDGESELIADYWLHWQF